MTPLPKRRHSTRRGGKRKASIKLITLGLSKCEHCGAKQIAHHMCPTCGYYAQKEVIKKKVSKKQSKN